ncbi:single-strand binding protein [Algoriphagus faecimaris]|uniref:Single-stranded DNA-binding protein n=1 Tax=Algoriphagus faecimaris TaxID=686796 RepID=A0A1G6W1P2_9BACT|nr:single-stranded DNA-binding protein [Algoriphagus faecimaris]SDD59718.1 single-strand binding protein [Algoriphagus faecimaris]
MNTLRNKVQLIGRLGDKVEIKNLESGQVLGKVSLAINESYKNQKGERVDNTSWHRLVLWGKQAEILHKFTDKGSEVAVEGKISNRSYTDKDGIKRSATEIVVNDFTFLGGKPSSQNNNQKEMVESTEDDLPF